MITPRIAARALDTPLMIHAGKAMAILQGLGGRLAAGGIVLPEGQAVRHVAFEGGRPSMGVIGDRLGRSVARHGRKPYDMVGNVAVIPIEGTLVHKGAWLESDSGETSYQGIQTQVAAAGRDASVAGVVFEVDSFGGEVSGAFQTADMISALSKAKPTIAIFTDNGLSSGYLLGAAARQVIVPETGAAGSIGVITIHTDMSAALDRAGLKVTILAAGAHKADFNPAAPLPEDVAARIRAELEGVREAFAGRVASYRGKRLTYERAMATEALIYRGAAAVTAGLADATGHPQEAFQAFVSTLNRA